MVKLISPAAEWCALLVEVIGIAVIVLTAVYTAFFALVQMIRQHHTETIFRTVRLRLGRGILLGLEFLIAADIIHTVAIELTFESLGILAIVVLIRTFLSFMLEVELTGSWHWQEKNESRAPPESGPS